MNEFLDARSNQLLVLIVISMVLITLWFLVPRLLRARQATLEMQHTEHMKALEQGRPLPSRDDATLAAGRTATLVPIISICAAATVTCFLGAFRTESMFSISLACWSVAGVVSLAAITGGVALMGRLANVPEPEPEDDEVSESTID
jgi:hypothetical protein